MHIAILFEFSSLNGGEHSMLSVLGPLIQKHDCRVTALAPATGPLADALRRINVPLVRFHVRDADGKKRSAEALTRELARHIQQLQPDVVHANSLSMSRLLGQAIPDRFPGVRQTGHIRDIMKISRKAIDDLNRLDQLAAVSQATRSFHVNQGLAAERCTVVYNGVDTNRFSRTSAADARECLLPNLPASACVVLNVGQMCLRKGQLDGARAITALLQHRDDIHLVLVGTRHSTKAESRDYEQEMIGAFEEAGRSRHLHRPGYRPDVADWMNAADVLLHCAHQEPLGRVLLEAAASELPIVATDVGGTREILRDERDALLVIPGEPAALASALAKVLDDRDAAQRRATSARQFVEDRFSLSQATEALFRFWAK